MGVKEMDVKNVVHIAVTLRDLVVIKSCRRLLPPQTHHLSLVNLYLRGFLETLQTIIGVFQNTTSTFFTPFRSPDFLCLPNSVV